LHSPLSLRKEEEYFACEQSENGVGLATMSAWNLDLIVNEDDKKKKGGVILEQQRAKKTIFEPSIFPF